jgi:hypothetical protein
VLFREAVRKFGIFIWQLKESFERFNGAAAKGHEESIWILSVVEGVEMEWEDLREAFSKTEEPLGWYFAGKFAGDEREGFDFYKKSAEGGCSWGQVAYGAYFRNGEFVEKDDQVYVEWLEKAANQNNPWAMTALGLWFRKEGDDKEKAVSYFHAGAELGWKWSIFWLAVMLENGEGRAKDLRQAVIWSAKGGESHVFWNLLEDAKGALESGAMENSDCDFDQLCFSLGIILVSVWKPTLESS